MNQAIHIFRKDVRHLWREISVALLLLIFYTATAPAKWMGESHGAIAGDFAQVGIALLPTLLFFTWSFLFIRAIQDERLVGDRQFWITRPYTWPSLLTAKVLFILAFLNLPLFLVGCILMLQSGFSPLHFLPGILFQQLALMIIFTLPVAAMASVTTKLTNMLLWLLGLVLGVLVLATVFGRYTSGGTPSSLQWVQALECFCIAFCAGIVVVFAQYSRRKTFLSRGVVVLAVVLLVLSGIFAPTNSLVSHFYPAQPPVSPFQLSFNPAAISELLRNGEPTVVHKNVIVSIPVKLSGLDPKATLALDGQQVTLETPDHRRWNSGWQSLGSYLSTSESPDVTRIEFAVPDTYFETASHMPVTAHIMLALSVLRPGTTTTIALPAEDFHVPGVGTCRLPDLGMGIHCLSPVRTPERWLVSTDWSGGTCPFAGKNSGAKPLPAHEWRQNFNPLPSGPDIVPIVLTEFGLSSPSDQDRRSDRPRAQLCPGTNVTFTVEETEQRLRQTIDIPDLHLRDLELTPKLAQNNLP